MHIEVIGEVLIAMFAMYGVFCAIQLVTELLFAPASFYLAVPARRGESEKEIYKRLCYAQLVSARERGAKSYPIIISESDEKISELKELGVTVYTAKEV